MALFTIPVRLASKAALLAADVAAAFASVVDAVNGGLNAANYAPGSWILNAHKTAPKTIGVLQFSIAQKMWLVPAGVLSYRQKMSTLAPGTMIEWGVTFGDRGGLVTAAFAVRLYRDGVQVGTEILHGNASPLVDRREVVASDPIVGDSLWIVVVEGIGDGAIPAIGVTVSVKAPHVR